jgi:hypothetical protein
MRCKRSYNIQLNTIMLKTSDPFTYDHRTLNPALPVCSAILKQCTGGLVARWVTTSESPLLYVFVLSCAIVLFLLSIATVADYSLLFHNAPTAVYSLFTHFFLPLPRHLLLACGEIMLSNCALQTARDASALFSTKLPLYIQRYVAEFSLPRSPLLHPTLAAATAAAMDLFAFYPPSGVLLYKPCGYGVPTSCEGLPKVADAW